MSKTFLITFTYGAILLSLAAGSLLLATNCYLEIFGGTLYRRTPCPINVFPVFLIHSVRKTDYSLLYISDKFMYFYKFWRRAEIGPNHVCESSPGSSDECSTQRQVAADLWTKPISLSQQIRL